MARGGDETLADIGRRRGGITEHPAGAHVGQEERVVGSRDRLEGRSAHAHEAGRDRQHRRRLGLARVPDRPEVDGKQITEEGWIDKFPVTDDRALLDESESSKPAPVAAVTVDDHDPREPRTKATDDRANELEQKLRLEGHRDAKPNVMGAEPRPDGRRDDDVTAS